MTTLKTLKDLWDETKTYNKTYSGLEVHAMKREFVSDLKQIAIEWHNSMMKDCDELGTAIGIMGVIKEMFNLTESDIKEANK